jgi:four helix bundle protein
VALASNDETIDHLETLFETGSLKNEAQFTDLRKKLTRLGIKLQNLIRVIRTAHQKTKK